MSVRRRSVTTIRDLNGCSGATARDTETPRRPTPAQNYFESLGTSFHWQTREQIGIYYLLRNEPDKALVVFNQTYEQSHDPYDAMHAALIADTIGKTDERDRILSIISDPEGKNRLDAKNRLYRRLVEFLMPALRLGPLNRIDFKRLEALTVQSPNIEAPVNSEYFVGLFLLNRGKKEKSREYLIRRPSRR